MMKTIRSVRLNVLLQLAIAVIFALSALIIVLLVSHNMHQQALKEAEAKARIILDRNLATHHYFTQELKPDIFEWTDSFRSPEYFSPAWMSSTYAVRAIDNFFKQLTDADYYYKEAAIDARMPANEADEYEATFLNKLSEEPNTLIESEIRTIADKPYYVLLRRGEMMEESCLRCHSEPDAAPAGLIDYYGPDRSFQRAVGETVSAISIRIPLDEAYANARNVTTTLSTLLLVVLGLLFLAQYVLNKHFVFAPLNHIRQRAREIAEDERHLGEQMPVPIGRELADLTTTFNVMSSTLLRDRQDLENRVQERTEELDNLNYQLREDIEKTNSRRSSATIQ